MIVVVEKSEDGRYLIEPGILQEALSNAYNDGYKDASNPTVAVPYVNPCTPTYKWDITCDNDVLPGQISMSEAYQGEVFNE